MPTRTKTKPQKTFMYRVLVRDPDTGEHWSMVFEADNGAALRHKDQFLEWLNANDDGPVYHSFDIVEFDRTNRPHRSGAYRPR